MNANVKMSQQDEDTQTQKDLTGKVGVRLTAQDKSASSPWSRVKRKLRLGLASSQFGSLSLTDSQLSRLRDWEVVDLLIEAGSSRLTAQRMVEIERGEAEPGRARRHTARR